MRAIAFAIVLAALVIADELSYSRHKHLGTARTPDPPGFWGFLIAVFTLLLVIG